VNCFPAISSNSNRFRLISRRNPETVIPPLGKAILTASESRRGVSRSIPSGSTLWSATGKMPTQSFSATSDTASTWDAGPSAAGQSERVRRTALKFVSALLRAAIRKFHSPRPSQLSPIIGPNVPNFNRHDTRSGCAVGGSFIIKESGNEKMQTHDELKGIVTCIQSQCGLAKQRKSSSAKQTAGLCSDNFGVVSRPKVMLANAH
jgi:hypothetical protein